MQDNVSYVMMNHDSEWTEWRRVRVCVRVLFHQIMNVGLSRPHRIVQNGNGCNVSRGRFIYIVQQSARTRHTRAAHHSWQGHGHGYMNREKKTRIHCHIKRCCAWKLFRTSEDICHSIRIFCSQRNSSMAIELQMEMRPFLSRIRISFVQISDAWPLLWYCHAVFQAIAFNVMKRPKLDGKRIWWPALYQMKSHSMIPVKIK